MSVCSANALIAVIADTGDKLGVAVSPRERMLLAVRLAAQAARCVGRPPGADIWAALEQAVADAWDDPAKVAVALDCHSGLVRGLSEWALAIDGTGLETRSLAIGGFVALAMVLLRASVAGMLAHSAAPAVSAPGAVAGQSAAELVSDPVGVA